MIDMFTTITVEGEPVTLFGKVNENEHTIELNYHITNKAAMNLGENFLHSKKDDLTLFDINAQQYSVYGCKFHRKSLHFSGTGVEVVTGSFDRIVRENELAKKYDTLIFSFVGIEKLFSLEKFNSKYETQSGEITYSKPEKKTLKYTLCENIECIIESRFAGTIKSNSLFELDIKQDKFIMLIFEKEKNVQELLDMLGRVKEYFEFVLKQEIQLKKVAFTNKNAPSMPSKLVSDSILQAKTFVKQIKDNPYSGSEENLLLGLDGWLKCYDVYSRAISIWKKTIYNANVSKEDLFLWRSQAFELLCTLNEEIFEKANSFKQKKQTHPNIKNFLMAVNELFSYYKDIDKYLKDVKDVRDKLTHNNPNKTVTEVQKENSYNLIEIFLTRTVCQVLGVHGISTNGLCLQVDRK